VIPLKEHKSSLNKNNHNLNNKRNWVNTNNKVRIHSKKEIKLLLGKMKHWIFSGMIKNSKDKFKANRQEYLQDKASLKWKKKDNLPIKLKKFNQLLVNLHRMYNLKDKDMRKEYYNKMNRSIKKDLAKT